MTITDQWSPVRGYTTSRIEALIIGRLDGFLGGGTGVGLFLASSMFFETVKRAVGESSKI